MKALLLSLCLMASLQTFGQSEMTKKVSGSPIEVSGVIKSDTSTKKSELYNRGQQFFATVFNSGKAVIQSQDKDAGFIIGKAIYIAPVHFALGTIGKKVDYLIKLEFKDGRIKYIISEYISDEFGLITDGKIIEYNHTFGHRQADKIWSALQDGIQDNNAQLISELTKYFENYKLEAW